MPPTTSSSEPDGTPADLVPRIVAQGKQVDKLIAQMSALMVALQPVLAFVATLPASAAFGATQATASASVRAPAAADSDDDEGDFGKIPWPSKFTGAKGSFKPWLDSVLTFLQLKKKPLNRKAILFTSTLLDGAARNWWIMTKQRNGDHPTAGFETWDAFIAALRTGMDEPYPEEVARTKLSKLQQTGSVMSYFTEYSQLMTFLPDRSEADHVHFFVAGLKPHIRAEVSVKHFTTLQAAYEHAYSYDSATFNAKRLTSSPSTNYPRYSNTSSNSHAASSTHATPMELGSITSTSSRRPPTPNRRRSPSPSPSHSFARPRSSVRFYPEIRTDTTPEERAAMVAASNQDGKPRCFYCKGIGHLKYDCPKLKADRDRRPRSPSRSPSPSKN